MRKIVITPALTKRLADGYRVGLTQELAAKRARIGESTLKRWLDKGRQDREAGRESPERTLLEALEEAWADRVADALSTIRAAATKGNWTAAAWLIERTEKSYSLVPQGPTAAAGAATWVDFMREMSALLQREDKAKKPLAPP